MSRGPSSSMVKGSVDYSSFEARVLRLDLARTDDVDDVESVLKFKDIFAYREYFDPLLIRELRSSIVSKLQEDAPNLLLCHCKSSKVLHGVYGPPSGQSRAPSSSTIISPVYAAAQAITEQKKPSSSTIFLEFSATQHVRPDPNAETLDQHDLVSIDLVDKRPLESGGAAARPPSPSGIVLSKYSILGIVNRTRGNKVEVQVSNIFGHPTLKELVCEGTACTMLRIDSLVTFRRKYAALQRLGSSPLCEGLLDPSILGNSRLMGHYLPADEHLGVLTPRFKDWIQDCLNPCQWNCVQRICSKTSPRVSLLQGPPGTGKTRVLDCVQSASKAAAATAAKDMKKKSGMVPIRTLMQPPTEPIHRNHVISRPHILVCAPSNAAVDELLLRITTGNTELRDFGCNVFRPPVIRMGNSEMMNENIMNVSLDSKVDKYVHMKYSEAKTKLDELVGMMSKKQFEIRLLEQEYLMLPHLVESFKKVIIDLKEDEHNFELQMSRLKSCMQCMTENKVETLAACSKSALHIIKSVLESSILDEAMVVFTTLTSAGRESLATVIFDVVLVDEACQSVELETLIPLCLGAKRCVLIGDPQQLPATVMSSSKLYRRSLFDRLQASGVELFMLTQQYRMHADICLFPSQYFYGTNLVCDESVGTREPLPKSSDYWLPPFVVFNISSTSTRSGSGYMNKDEACFVQLYIQHILRRHSDIKMANFVVLTPYRAQVKAIKAALPDIRVATVDSFQGQESDFVVFSAVRAGNSRIGFVKDMQRLNVAITRAKHALIVVCDVRTMESNEGWRNLIRSANSRGFLSHVPVASHGSFKQQVDHFLSKSSPFDVYDARSQQRKPQKPQTQPTSSSSGLPDPRLQPTLQIASRAVPLPPSMQTVAPKHPIEIASSSASRIMDAATSPISVVSVSLGAQDAVGTVPRPQKRAASPPARQPPAPLQPQQFPQPTQHRPSELRVAERAQAEQERQRQLQELHRDVRTSSSVSHQNHHQHEALQSSRQSPSPQSLQPPVKRERLNDNLPQSETGIAGRSGSPAFVSPVANIPVPQSDVPGERPNAHVVFRPPPPPGQPPVDPNKSPLKEQLLAVERLFAVPVLCAIIQHNCCSWTHSKTVAIATTLSRALHTSLSMTYDAEALRIFITRLQRGNNPYASTACHSTTMLPEDLTTKLANLIRQVLGSHSNMK